MHTYVSVGGSVVLGIKPMPETRLAKPTALTYTCALLNLILLFYFEMVLH